MILVTGATGTVGSQLVRELLKRDAQTRALVRSREKAAMFDGLNVEIAMGNLEDPPSVAAALEGVSHLFLLTAVPANQVELETRLLGAAAQAGVEHIVKLSASNVSEDSDINFFRWHREIERRIEESGIGWTHVQPNNFFQNTLFQLESIREQGSFFGPFGAGRVASVDTRDVAEVAAIALTDPACAGAALELTGPAAITHDEMAATLSKALGREIGYHNVSLEDFHAGMLEHGQPSYFADGLTTLYGQLAEGAQSRVTDTIEALTGRPARSFADFAADYVDAFVS